MIYSVWIKNTDGTKFIIARCHYREDAKMIQERWIAKEVPGVQWVILSVDIKQ